MGIKRQKTVGDESSQNPFYTYMKQSKNKVNQIIIDIKP